MHKQTLSTLTQPKLLAEAWTMTHFNQSQTEQLIAIGGSDVLLYEEMNAAKAEIESLNNQLTDINDAVTPFRIREQIIKIIGEQLKKVVNFDSFYITNERYGSEFAENLPATVFNYDELHQNLLTKYPIADAEKEAGLKSGTLLALKVNNKSIGRLVLSSYKHKNEAFPAQKFSLLEKLCEPIAIGVKNLLLYQEMQAAKLEIESLNQQLMDINNAVTPFRTREQMMRTIGGQLKKIIHYDSFYIISFGPLQDTYSFFLDGTLPEIMNDPRLKDFLERTHSVVVNANDEIVDSTYVQSLQTQTVKYTDLDESFLKRSPIARIEKELGMQEILVLPLRLNGVVIAALNLCSFTLLNVKRSLFSTLEKIAEPIAIGVSNVLLFEEMQRVKAQIEQKEKEKSLQIAVTNAILDSSKWDDRLKKVAACLRNVISWDMLSLCIQEKPGENEVAFTYLVQPDGTIHPETDDDFFRRSGISPEEHASLLVEFGQQLLVKPGFYNQPEYSAIPSRLHQLVIKTYGFHSGLYLPLEIDHPGTCRIIFSSRQEQGYTQEKLDLLMRLAPSISIALSKVYTSDALLQQQQEMSLQLSVTNVLTSTRDWETAFRGLAAMIDAAIPCDYFGLAFIDEDRQIDTFNHRRTADGAWERWDAIAELRTVAAWHDRQHTDSVAEWTDYLFAPGICNEAKYDALVEANTMADICPDHFGHRSALRLPFRLKGRPTSALIYMASKNPEAFTPQHLDQMRRLIPALSLALENLFAFKGLEQANAAVQARANEIKWLNSQLMEINNAVTPLKTREEAMDTIKNQLAQILSFDGFYITLYSQDYSTQAFFIEALAPEVKRYLPPASLKPQPFSVCAAQTKAGATGERMPLAYYRYKDIPEDTPWLKFPVPAAAIKAGMKESLEIPLYLKDRLMGALRLHSKEKDRFAGFNQDLLPLVATPVAISMSNVLLYEEMQTAKAEVERLSKQLNEENEYLHSGNETKFNHGEIVGQSPEMQKVYRMVSQVASMDSTVLILGNTGTGKELIARAIHNASRRKDKLLVKVNCAALPPQLIESELFGHERGSFTGATDRRIGKFELAHNGTLFLDEVGELPLNLQAKLLRAIQEKEIERLGSNKVIKTDTRIIAATNRKLDQEVRAGTFRSDLYFRLNIFPIPLPLLSQRKEDIPLLANHFLHKFSEKMNKKIAGIDPATMKAMIAYQWPGNIRELENVIERAVIINESKTLRFNLVEFGSEDLSSTSVTPAPFLVKSYQDAERELIMNTLEITQGRIRGPGGAAELLQVHPATLTSRMKKLGLVKKHFRK